MAQRLECQLGNEYWHLRRDFSNLWISVTISNHYYDRKKQLTLNSCAVAVTNAWILSGSASLYNPLTADVKAFTAAARSLGKLSVHSTFVL